MDKKQKRGISRRQFIQGLGVGAGILSVGGLDMAQAALLPEPKRKERFDVIVIGTGLSGMAAALEAQGHGRKVAALDKMPAEHSSGNSRFAAGVIVIPSENSPKAKEDYYEDFMKKSMGNGNAMLYKVLADQSMEGVEWLRSLGIELTPPTNIPGFRMKGVIFSPGLYKGMPKALENLKLSLEKKGGKIFYQTKAKQLIMDTSGSVIGVRAVDHSGVKDFLADAVVIAAGGYSANGQMLEEYVDPNADQMMVRGVKWATGDGLKMAEEAGATLVNMGGMVSLHVAAVSPKSTASGNPFPAIPFTVGINKEGKRYVDESKGYVANGKAVMRQPGQTVAMIFDEEMKKLPGVATSFKLFQDLKLEVVEADSLSELATKINVPPKALEQTIEEYNAAVKENKALEAKPPKTAFAYKIATPKFYAFYPLVPGITLTFGGIKINDNAQVQEADGRIIRGLYAGGECAGGLYYDDYIGGGSLVNCLVMGRVAGKSAATLRVAKK